MKVKMFFAIVVSLSVWQNASAQSFLNYYNGNQAKISDDEIKSVITTAKTPSENGIRASYSSLATLPDSSIQWLLQLNESDVKLRINDEYSEFMRYFNVSYVDTTELRHEFISAAAKEIISNLRKKPKSLVRILARDLNEIYSQVESYLHLNDGQLNLSVKEKIQILNRIRLVPASRPIIDDILKGGNARKEILALFSISEQQLAGREIILLDSGYEGSIAKKLLPIFKSQIDNGSLKWNFLWKAPNAPAFISRFAIPDFEAKLKARGQLEKFMMADKPYSFRVAMLEHFPKWTGRMLAFKNDPTIIMLDLDDTVLKEVDIEKYRRSAGTQLITYTPSSGVAAKYKERLAAAKDPNKTIHFEFNGNQMTGALSVRPSIIAFVNQLEDLVKSGKVRLLITSNNDAARTQAVFSQVKIGAKTLQELGGEYVPSNLFNDARHRKDISLLRINLGISERSKVLAIDDLPGNYVVNDAIDLVEGVRAFDKEYSERSLANQSAELHLQDTLQLNRLYEAILESIIVTEAQPLVNKLRAAYLTVGQTFYTNGLTSAPLKCQNLFIGAR